MMCGKTGNGDVWQGKAIGMFGVIVMRYFEMKEFPELRFDWHTRLSLNLWIPLKQFCYKRDNGLCCYCQKQVEYRKSHCHHTLELSEGGTNHPTNLKTLCIPCHKKRHPFMLSAKEKLI